jgi:hypothetical protein
MTGNVGKVPAMKGNADFSQLISTCQFDTGPRNEALNYNGEDYQAEIVDGAIIFEEQRYNEFPSHPASDQGSRQGGLRPALVGSGSIKTRTGKVGRNPSSQQIRNSPLLSGLFLA